MQTTLERATVWQQKPPSDHQAGVGGKQVGKTIDRRGAQADLRRREKHKQSITATQAQSRGRGDYRREDCKPSKAMTSQRTQSSTTSQGKQQEGINGTVLQEWREE